MGDLDSVRRSYDTVAEAYAARFVDELQHKPMDRALLACLAEQVAADGRPVADVGCGPGHVTQHLHGLGLTAVGVDPSPKMLAIARRLHRRLTFVEGSLLALPVPDAAWAGVVAFYSVIHLAPGERPAAWRELHRALAPGGRVLLAFHIGDEAVHVEDFLGQQVSMDAFFLQPAAIAEQLETAGFVVEVCLERLPYPEVEYPSRRAYVLARKP